MSVLEAISKKFMMWKKTDPDSKSGAIHAPKYPGDAGFDLEVSQYCDLQPDMLTMVPCGVAIAIPAGYCALVIARSSAVAGSLFVYPTLIDEGYPGPLYIMVRNLNKHSVEVMEGQRLAQLLLIAVPDVSLLATNLLPESTRGSNGFGSSGK